MDTKSLKTLEFHKILNQVATYTSFSAGESLVRALHPTTDRIEAEQWQNQTKEAIVLLDTHSGVTIGGARDVRPACDNSQRGFTLPAEDLLDIRNTVIAGRNLNRAIIKAADDYPHLAAIAELIEDCPGLVTAVNNTIDERGEVLDSASSKLAKIRAELRTTHGRIQDRLQRLLGSSQSQWLQEAIITQRNGRYVVPVRAEAKGRIKGIVHDQSGSGATLWIEPIATVELNNDYRSLQLQEQEEINRILKELSGKVAEHSDSIKRIVERIAELDLVFARARYANQINGIQPEFVEWRQFPQPKPPKHANQQDKWTPPPRNLHPGSTIWIRQARHPLLNPHTVIPTDITLADDLFTLLITGPNTGGKTVSLKTTGLMVLMAQSGLHLPAVEARLTIFDNIFADIGDEQSIEQSLSTFSAHMSNIIRILDKVDERSLVLFDELGSGTDPTEGAALAQAVVNFLRDKGATAFVATHYPELKLYADQNAGATNASLMFDIETLSPTYEMAIGIPGKSNAFAIARRLGLDDTILDEAMALTGAGNNQAESMLDAIYDLREKMAAEEAATRLALREIEEQRDMLARQLEQIEEERQKLLAETQEEARTKITAVEDELRKARQTIRDAQSLTKLKQASQAVQKIEAEEVEAIVPKTEKTRRPTRNSLEWKVGDQVRVKALNTQGDILSLGKYDALVAIGQMQMRVKLSDLEWNGRAEAEPEPTYISVATRPSPGLELDIRGRRIEEGLEEVASFLDRAALARMPWVRIIHGKGTGRLKHAIRRALKDYSHVLSWEDGRDGEGGDGVTVVKFADDD